MYPTKKNVCIVIALLKDYGISEVVVSPGSRNAPLVQGFSQDPFFHCRVVVDERAAAFEALGIAQCTEKPVVACCTSGTALLNYAPAVAEAYYQELPLVILSADRAPEWIGQTDGQTLPQPDCFGSLVKCARQIPEIRNESETWYAERLCNEALTACTHTVPGPVHLNIPISEPLFDYSEPSLPETKRIRMAEATKQVELQPFADRWQTARRRLIVVGQSSPANGYAKILEKLMQRTDCVVCTEHASNCSSPLFITKTDLLLYAYKDKTDFQPDLVLSFGGAILSKRLKEWLRQVHPQHWLIHPGGEMPDLFQSLTDVIEMEPTHFLTQLSDSLPEKTDKPFYQRWKDASALLFEPTATTPFSDLSVTGTFLKHLPHGACLHIANSSAIRNAALFALDPSIRVYTNRGTNGIDSSLPAAIGFASVTEDTVYLLIGDLSFFYGLNALWNNQGIKNLRILLLNNGGGGIFHLLPGLNRTESLEKYVSAGHHTEARPWVEAAGWIYLQAHEEVSLATAFKQFFTENSSASVVLEVRTDIGKSKEIFQAYYHQQKNR